MPHTNATAQANPAQVLDNQLCFALYSASLSMTKLYKPLLDAVHLTYPQYLVFLALWESDGPSVSTLGARLHLDSGTLTPLLKRMEAAGWLQRQRSSEDERKVHVCLTPLGQQMQTQTAHIPGCVASHSGVPLDELMQLNRQIRQLRGAIHLPTRSSPSIHPRKHHHGHQS